MTGAVFSLSLIASNAILTLYFCKTYKRKTCKTGKRMYKQIYFC